MEKTLDPIKNFSDWLNDKSNPMVYCLLSIDGEDFLAKNTFEITLRQRTNEHDTFTIIVPDDALDSFEGYLFEHSKQLLGKNIKVSYWQYGAEKQYFLGIITGIKNERNEGGGYGMLHITGHSPSILLESGQNNRSFEDKTLEQVIKEIGQAYPQDAQITTNQLNNTQTLPYTVQSYETDYGFIQRLARRYGEFFYYNGKTLVFGNQVEPMIELGENRELINVSFELGMKAQRFSFLGYDSEKSERWLVKSEDKTAQWKENPFQSVAINASKRLFGGASEMLWNGEEGFQRGEQSLLREKENRENLLIVKGKSREPNLRIGGRAKLSDINDKAMETYRILEITHHHNGNEYYNEFVGIPDVFHAPYQDNFALPRAEEQVAKVMDNADPKGMGRVRVQMLWQEKHNEKTPWLRLVQPHAGGGKGFYFVPEIGEEVLVGFEGGNAEKPYIIGTHYNGKEKSGYADSDNKIKAIHTRSGHLVKFTEEESIIITDKSGNEIHLDTTGGNINITAPNTMTLNAKTLNINVAENMTTNVGANQSNSVGMNKTNTVIMNYTESVGGMKNVAVMGNFFTNVTGKLTHYVKGDMETFGEKENKLISLEGIQVNSGGSVEQHSEKEVKNNSGEQSKIY